MWTEKIYTNEQEQTSGLFCEHFFQRFDEFVYPHGWSTQYRYLANNTIERYTINVGHSDTSVSFGRKRQLERESRGSGVQRQRVAIFHVTCA